MTVSWPTSEIPSNPSRERDVLVAGLAGWNLGDTAIAIATDRAIRNVTSSVGVVSVNRGSLAPYNLTEVVVERRSPGGLYSLIRELHRSRVIVLGGGTLIQDRRITLMRGVLPYSAQIATLAKAIGTPITTVAIGVDELSTRLGRRWAAQLLRNTRTLRVRDEHSASITVGLRKQATPRVFSDPAYALSCPNTLERSETVVLALAKENIDYAPLLPLMADAIRHVLTSQTVNVTLLCMDPRDHEEIAVYRQLVALLEPQADRIRIVQHATVWDAIAILQSAALVIAMRLHALIFAVGHSPLIVLSRTTKTDTALAAFGLTGWPVGAPPASYDLRNAIDQHLGRAPSHKQVEQRAASEASAEAGLRDLADELVQLLER